ncbi:MAG: cryptochrome/photolyase family protein [Caldilineales bacterium]|nr:cryptochrome/photolyase family protein [Caldilineales bacterium]MDW8316849.1 cryptochrome/photolyase family protein [Anaerolineae bacterium]
MAPPLSVWILGDQLLAHHPALAAAEQAVGRDNVRVVLVESAARSRRLPYQRKKLVLLFSAMRHYAEDLRSQGWQVDYVRAETTRAGLQAHVAQHQPAALWTMAASEVAGRRWQHGKLAEQLGLPVRVLPNTQFLVGRFDPFPNAGPDQRVVLETFYRAMRRHFRLLMDGDQPVGGRWNFDAENRKPLPKGLRPPPPPSYPPDVITRQVMAEVAAMPGTGTVDGFDLAVTRGQAEAAFQDFLAHRLANFGPYEDAMSSRHPLLFHSLLSPYLNIGLLEPLALAQAAERAYRAGQAPLNSVEGFVRQVIGWREYIYWQYWRLADRWQGFNAWRAQRALPDFFWTGDTDLACLQTAIRRALHTGYTHHIERLMLICNFCLLAGVEPLQVNRWFLATYVDAYEWVMLPNVLGMGLNADGGRTATKPYAASANYIHRMSDYCAGCRYDPKARVGADACPFNFLYWNFLLEHEETLRRNPRLGNAVLGLRHLDEAERARVREQAAAFLGPEADDR